MYLRLSKGGQEQLGLKTNAIVECRRLTSSCDDCISNRSLAFRNRLIASFTTLLAEQYRSLMFDGNSSAHTGQDSFEPRGAKIKK